MRVNQIHGGRAEMRALLYPQKDPTTIQFLQDRLTEGMERSRSYGQMAMDFYERAQAKFDQHFGEEAVRLANAALRKTQGMFVRDDIRELTDLGATQNANTKMRRFIMANPLTRELYHQQRCNGYSGLYVDPEPGVRGVNQYDYRMVTNHVVMEDDDGGWHVAHHVDDVKPGDTALSIHEQGAILTTWEWINATMALGDDDPVSPTAGKL